MKKFTNQYQLSKTLRFELTPQGKTLENIMARGLIAQDEKRAVSYQSMKKVIDEYHKDFIAQALKHAHLSNLHAYFNLYTLSDDEKKKDEKFKDKLSVIQTKLRKEVVACFKSPEFKERFTRLDKKELIKEDLEAWVMEHQDNNSVIQEYCGSAGLTQDLNDFKKFTTYFTGFHENRQNMYTDEAHSTAIAYRIVHENLPKFIDNVLIFDKIKNNNPELLTNIQEVETSLASLIQGKTLEEVFTLDFFNQLLDQKGIDFLNTVIGGVSEKENQPQIQGLNVLINLYNQKQSDKKNRVPKFTLLYKQILSDRESLSFLPPAFEKDQEVLDAINTFYREHILSNTLFEQKSLLEAIKNHLADLKQADLSKIYLRNDTGLTAISQVLFGEYGTFSHALDWHFNTNINPSFQAKFDKETNDEKLKKLLKIKENFTKSPYISIANLQAYLDSYVTSLEADHPIRSRYTVNIIADYFTNHFHAKNKDNSEKIFDFIANITAKFSCIQGVLNNEWDKTKNLKSEQKLIDDIKGFLDAIMEVLHFIKPLAIKNDGVTDKDLSFYAVYDVYSEELSKLISLYNMVRNYLTQKPYSIEKIKLNFENAKLLDGWDRNKEKDYLTTLLRKDGLYYLAIMDKKHNKLFELLPDLQRNSILNCYEKMVYKLLPGVNKMLPKVFFAKSNIDYFAPSEQLLANYKNDTHKKGDTFRLEDCHALIDFFKVSLSKHEDWKHFNFKFSDTKSYVDLSGFYREVEHQGYKMHFENIPQDYIQKAITEGQLYLFQIYNKDFSSFSKGKPNLHTLYWKALFDESNLKNVFYKLNGAAEMFFRKKSILDENKTVHPAHQAIKAKNPLYPNKNTFDYDLIKDKRFTLDKFQFHVPITLNFKATGQKNLNTEALMFLQENPEMKVIGLDRGERHLIYLSLINHKGEIEHQESLNVITGTVPKNKSEFKTDYQKLLDNKENERANARESWGTIENIKELKAGYLSQVVHKITTMMLEHNAIVVMEDLNFGFKNGRFKVEKQVYQKFEKALIDKLNYLVLKDREFNEAGGVFHALQLTNKFESFKKMGKQSGFLFYVPAWNTSKIDPATGFVDFLKPRYESKEKSQAFFEKFKAISFNPEQDYFKFSFDYNNFHNKAAETKTQWVVCTHGKKRYVWDKSANQNKGATIKIDVTAQIKELLNTENIDFEEGQDLKDTIVASESIDLFKGLMRYLSVTLAMRYSSTAEGRDFILSPVADDNGIFFNSETADKTQPQDADANGAYHIAKKGLWVLEQIRDYQDSEKLKENEKGRFKELKLAISNKEWLQYIQSKTLD